MFLVPECCRRLSACFYLIRILIFSCCWPLPLISVPSVDRRKNPATWAFSVSGLTRKTSEEPHLAKCGYSRTLDV